MSRLGRFWTGMARSAAETAPDAADARLRGRTYAIPFDRVWETALGVVNRRLRRWRVLGSDDYEGEIRAEARGPLFRRIYDVTVRISLDEDAQTRVDARSVSRAERADFGANARCIAALFHALDRELARRAPAATTRRQR